MTASPPEWIISALYRREATGAQLLRTRAEPPESAVGQTATRPTPAAHVYQLEDGWIVAEAEGDLSDDLAGMTRAEAIDTLLHSGVPAATVQSVGEAADHHREAPSSTVIFERTETDGLASECFAPTWIVLDGKPFPRSFATARAGADAPATLRGLGHLEDEVARLISQDIARRPARAPI